MAKNEKKNESVVRVEVNVTQIVKYVCITGVLIVAIIFGCKAWSDGISLEDLLPGETE